MRRFKVPLYSELAVNNIFPKIKEQNQLKLYMPDLSENEFPEREFFNTILGTLFPLIKMTPEIYSEIVGLLSYPSRQK